MQDWGQGWGIRVRNGTPVWPLLGCIWEEKKGGAHTDTHVGAIRILSAQPLEL